MYHVIQTVVYLCPYKDYNELPLTGQLDDPTLQLMNTTRCGMEDEIPTSSGSVSLS